MIRSFWNNRSARPTVRGAVLPGWPQVDGKRTKQKIHGKKTILTCFIYLYIAYHNQHPTCMKDEIKWDEAHEGYRLEDQCWLEWLLLFFLQLDIHWVILCTKYVCISVQLEYYDLVFILQNRHGSVCSSESSSGFRHVHTMSVVHSNKLILSPKCRNESMTSWRWTDRFRCLGVQSLWKNHIFGEM